MKETECKITKDMTLKEIIEKYPKCAQVFMNHGLFCFSCPAASSETLEQGATSHGIDVEKLLKELKKGAK